MNLSHLCARLFLVLLTLQIMLPGIAAAADPAPMPYEKPGTLLIGYERHVTNTELRGIAHSVNAEVAGVIPQIGVARLHVRGNTSAAVLASRLFSKGALYVEPELRFHTLETATSNDPYATRQWHLQKIQAPHAWPLAPGNSKFPLAVIDTGVDKFHPDLSGRIVGGRNFLPGATATNYGDDNGHGTHVAGLAAAAVDNGVGVSGVSKLAPVYAVKVLDSFGWGDESVIAQGIVWAADRGVKVINLSLGTDAPADSSGVKTLKRAVDYAVNKGVVVVAAAGNSGEGRLNYPAGFSNVLSVGATDQNDRRASWSNYGSGLDISAPGTGIYSTTPRGTSPYLINTQQTTRTYGYMSGTSMASPIVAGAVAAVWAHMPSLTAWQVKGRLLNTAKDIGTAGYDRYTGYGRLDMLRAARLYSSVTGLVRDPSGKVVGGATVRLGTSMTTTTDSLGKYKFTRVLQGTYTLSAAKVGVGIVRRSLNARDGVSHSADLALVARGSLKGPTRDAASGAVLRGVTVAIPGVGHSTVSDNKGTYLIWSLAPGTYKVVASLGGYQSQTRIVTIEVGKQSWLGFSLQPE